MVNGGERLARNGETERASSLKGLGNSDPSVKRGNGSPSRSFNGKMGARVADPGGRLLKPQQKRWWTFRNASIRLFPLLMKILIKLVINRKLLS